ncbi:MAG: hypothetical protein LBU35_01495 [Holosporales bacterium]|jgi:hypothetical protein|nr:hypothetical protein [Holosporales bacterium]
MKKLREMGTNLQRGRSSDGIFKEKYRHRLPGSWTIEEFEKLKKGFLCGKKIKAIATEIGRSETAVNKFLSKSGIRRLAPKRRKSEPYCYRIKRVNNIICQPAGKTKKDYASFADIISYIVQNGHTVRKNREFGNMFYKNEEYVLDEKPLTKAKLLIFANKLRVEDNKPIFKVMDFICE